MALDLDAPTTYGPKCRYCGGVADNENAALPECYVCTEERYVSNDGKCRYCGVRVVEAECPGCHEFIDQAADQGHVGFRRGLLWSLSRTGSSRTSSQLVELARLLEREYLRF